MSQPRERTQVEPGSGLIADIFQLAREMRATVDRELPAGITTQQAALVLVSRLEDGCGVSHLAERLGADAAGITRLVDRLEAKGIVVRGDSPSDRRMVVVKVTRSGDQMTADLRAAFHRAHERLLAGMEPDEIERFRALVARLRDNLAPPDGSEPA